MPSSHLALLRASRAFAGVDDVLLEGLARASSRQHFTRGEAIWRAGQRPAGLTIIATGLVKVCRPRPDGSESIVCIFGPHESVGDTAVVLRQSYPADAIAATDAVEVVCVDKTVVFDMMNREVAVANALGRSIACHHCELLEKIRIMTAGPVDRRLATLLLHLAERFGDEQDDGTTVIPVPLSRAELACLIGATVETTIRFMSKWQKAGILSTSDSGFSIACTRTLESAAAGEAADS